MKKIYLKLLVGIIIILWAIYFIQILTTKNKEVVFNIYSTIRPYIRNINQKYN